MRVSTNVTGGVLMDALERVMRSLRPFDHVIVDLSRFGEVRDQASQAALIASLQQMGFDEAARAYAAGDTDIRHFQRKARERMPAAEIRQATRFPYEPL